MPIKNIINKQFYLMLAFIFLAELFSLFGYLLADFRQVAFLVITGITIILSLKRLEYGILILLAELFIGSKGYLFYFESGGVVISIRIALWLIVMSVWFGKVISRWIKKKKLSFGYPKLSFNGFAYFFILFIFIIWGLVNAILNNNEFNNIFFDFNGWLYFSLIFPLYSVYKPLSGFKSHLEALHRLFQLFLASIVWLSLKTFFLLFVFSHNLVGMTQEIYYWIRTTGVGEITQMQGGFYRIFFQSHIFVLIGFFIFLFLFTNYYGLKNKLFFNKKYLVLLSVVCCLSSVILITFSRSFWAGLIIGLLTYSYIVIESHGWKKLFMICVVLLGTSLFSVLLITGVVKFPYPAPTGGFLTTELLTKRTQQISDEAAVSSRWNLLPELWKEIKKAPILGKGYGSTVTYISNDPRVRQTNPAGEYSTYAFEWGWLDIWLKLGFFGMLAYLTLIGKLIYDGFKIRDEMGIIKGALTGLVVLVVVSMFSPYLNHPLGIGYLILVSVLINYKK